MSIKLVVGSEILNVVSVYAPPIGLGEDIKRLFWEELDEAIQSIPETEKLLVEGDFNGHIWSSGKGYETVPEALAMARGTVEGCRFWILRLLT